MLWTLEPRGALNFFQVGVCSPDFRNLGLANWYLPLKEGACKLKIHLGACELKVSKLRGLWAKIWAKIEAVEAKISKFSKDGVLWTDSFAWNVTLANYRRVVERGLQGRTSPYPLCRSVPPQLWSVCLVILCQKLKPTQLGGTSPYFISTPPAYSREKCLKNWLLKKDSFNYEWEWSSYSQRFWYFRTREVQLCSKLIKTSIF